jgi:hypothetical protein
MFAKESFMMNRAKMLPVPLTGQSGFSRHCRRAFLPVFRLKNTIISGCVLLLVMILHITLAGIVHADPSVPSETVPAKESVKSKKSEINRERAVRFYGALERLLNAYGEDHSRWPDNADRRVIEAFLKDKDALALNNCVFGWNLLGLGIGETTKDAEEAMKEGALDAWGRPYSLVLAGSKDVPRMIELLYAYGVNRGVSLFNRDITAKVFVFLKADFHSLFADVFKNFNGASILILAREVHIIGGPGSAERDYREKLQPALCASDTLEATVYIGENDPVTEVVPKTFRDKVQSLFGYVIPRFRGVDPEFDGCKHKKPPPVKIIRLKGCSHDIPEYYPHMKVYGRTMLKTKETP